MTTSTLILPPLSLYIHVPWCVRKCPYCDFNSHQKQGELPEAQYVDALLEDLRLDSAYIQGRSLQSIFIGGGTPSLFSAESYEKLLGAIKTIVPFAEDIEITLEANPGTFEQEKFSAYRQTGINRLSIGIQSFNDVHLKQLGRIHGGDEARRAASIARNAGFTNFNLDLMFGLPGQTSAQACDDLQTAIACEPTHLSWYQLTIEPNTEYFSKPPTLPQDDAIAEMQEVGISLLENNGYARYEISAYSKPGRQARHNLNYWDFGDYLGIGAGAHGKVTLPETGAIVRTRKTRMPAHYLDPAREFSAETKTVAAADLPLEFMLNALRLNDGVPLHYFAERTGLAAASLQKKLQKLQQRGLLIEDPLRLQPTALGLLHLNELLVEFM
ncbi:MAG: radical SAM family heme chaperone HemW [Pseudomonadota bacterium]